MAHYYVAAIGPAHAQDLYIRFCCPMRNDDFCWPLPWAGTWSEADVVDAAAELNNGVATVAVPTDAVHALATAPSPGKIDGDVGPVVRNSASNRRALIVAARRNIARMAAFGIPRTADAARDDEEVAKALRALMPLLGRAENIENDRLWGLRAELLGLLQADDRRRSHQAVQAVHAVAASGTAIPSETRTPQRPPPPVQRAQEPGQAEVAILRLPQAPVAQQPPSPDTAVGPRLDRP